MSTRPKYEMVAARELNSSSEPSLTSAGPSQKEPALITSTWGIGWQTPILMIASYVLALAIAIAHLLLFRYIDGKEADGPNRVAPQSYVTTASNILANAFGFSLRASLAVAFVQYLWHLLRVSTMKVSTIELLFTIRTNLFMIFRAATLRAAPTLCALAILMWALQVATSFPPGAITVGSVAKIRYREVTIPTFNASFMGNASGADANTYSLANLDPPASASDGFVMGQGTKNRNLLPRVAYPVLARGEAFVLPSPCGVNCSYTTEFEGPYFQCENHTADFPHATQFFPSQDTFTIYSGIWTDKYAPRPGLALYNGTYSISNFNSTVLTPLQQNTTDGALMIRRYDLYCLPGRAKFTVNNTWTNNIQQWTVVSEPIDRLVNLRPPTHDSIVIVNGFVAKNGYGYGTQPANWTAESIAYYRDAQHMTIIASMMKHIVGAISSTPVLPSQISVQDGGTFATLINGTSGPEFNGSVAYDVVWNLPSQTNFTIIESTRFNKHFAHFKAGQPADPVFGITAEALNEHLFNLTISMMQAFGTWNTSTNATVLTTVNVYSFSNPLNLFLPYFLTLLLSIPFLLLGWIALLRNGVSAMDSSFMQIIATSTGSATLDRAAAGGCLGGDESASQELKDLKIRFGEIVGRKSSGQVKRAGFGVDDEVTELQKGARYGIARWL